MSSTEHSGDSGDTGGEPRRQRVVRVRGARRAQLTPAPGTDVDPDLPQTHDAPAPGVAGAGASKVAAGPNDERLRRDVPPHY